MYDLCKQLLCDKPWVVAPLQSLVALEACYWSIVQGAATTQQPGAAGRQATLKQKRKVCPAPGTVRVVCIRSTCSACVCAMIQHHFMAQNAKPLQAQSGHFLRMLCQDCPPDSPSFQPSGPIATVSISTCRRRRCLSWRPRCAACSSSWWTPPRCSLYLVAASQDHLAPVTPSAQAWAASAGRAAPCQTAGVHVVSKARRQPSASGHRRLQSCHLLKQPAQRAG